MEDFVYMIYTCIFMEFCLKTGENGSKKYTGKQYSISGISQVNYIRLTINS